MEALPQDLADFLVTKNFDPEYFDKQGQPSEAGDATTIKFDYVADSGKNYGTAVCVISNDELSLYYGDNLGRGMEPEDKDEWYSFLEQLSNQAASHSATWSPTEINKLKHNLAGIAAIKEGLFEGYYGSKKVSYMGEQTQARLVINHNRVLGEHDKRFRYVESLFIETADQERFRLPFKSLSGGRAMLEHVRSGGRPYDVRGNHITEVVSEMAVLSRFNRAQHHRVFEGVTQELVESAQQYYRNLQETIKHLGSPRGYQAYFESWAPDQVGEAEALVENLRDLFVEQTLDARIEAALPTLAKIQQQGNNMKEAQIFENWINNLSEGTWALPETPEQMEKLNQLMSSELIVGPDATNATEQLYDIVGDDELFDILNDLADRSEGRANCWDDSDVQRRLAELGIQTPESTRAEPADVDQDTAPPVNEGDEISMKNPGKLSNQEYKDSLNRRYGQPDLDTSKLNKSHQDYYDKNPSFKQAGKEIVTPGDGRLASKVVPAVTDTKVDRVPMNTFGAKQGSDIPKSIQKGGGSYTSRMTGGGGMGGGMGLGGGGKDPMNKGINPLKLENAELARMLQHAGVPLQEGVLNDDTRNTWDHLLDRFRHEVEQFKQGSDLDSDLYDALFDYYDQHGAMPYRVRNAKDGTVNQWISNRLADDLGINENLISPIIMPVSEGSCNMTMEGSYCPEHGLAECGSMYEDSRLRTVPPRPSRPGQNLDTPRTKSVAGLGRGVVNPTPVNSMDDSIPHVEIRGFGPDFEDLPAGKKLINPMQPRRHNELSPLEPGDSTSHSPVAHVDLTMDEGVYDPDYKGGYNNEFDELEDLLSRSGMSQDDLMRQRFLASKHGLNTPADMAKLPALKKDAETGYVARKAALDADLEKRNQQYMQDKLTDLEYQQDPVAFVKRRTQQLAPTAPSAPTTPNAPANVAAEPGVDYSLPRAKLGSSPSAKFPNFRPEPSAEVPAPLDQTDTRNQKSSMFQQLAQLRNRTRGTMAENNMGLEPIEQDPDWNTYDSEVSGSTTVTNKDGKDSYVKKTTSTDTNPAGKKRYTTTTDVDGVQTFDRRYADEGVDDPINYNAAMTGAYYEGKETRTQEGDALLARIKSLALLR